MLFREAGLLTFASVYIVEIYVVRLDILTIMTYGVIRFSYKYRKSWVIILTYLLRSLVVNQLQGWLPEVRSLDRLLNTASKWSFTPSKQQSGSDGIIATRPSFKATRV